MGGGNVLSWPLSQQQTSGDPGLSDAGSVSGAGPSSTDPAVVGYMEYLARTQGKPGGLPADAPITRAGTVPAAPPTGAVPAPRAPGSVPMGNTIPNIMQARQAQMALASQMGRGGQVPIQTQGVGVTPGLTMNPVQPFQPTPFINTPTESYGSTRAKGIANLVIGASNVVGQFMNKQQEEKQRVLAVDLERVLNAQQGMQQAQTIMQDPNATPEQKQNAQTTFQKNQDIINTTMSNPKTAKQIGKALDINFTDPQQNKTPENAALQQAIKTMQVKQQAQAQQRQQAGSNMLIPPGGLAPQQQAQPPQAPQQVPQPGQATGYAAQLMAKTPQLMVDYMRTPEGMKLQAQLLERQMTIDAANQRAAQRDQQFQQRLQFDANKANAEMQQRYDLAMAQLRASADRTTFVQKSEDLRAQLNREAAANRLVTGLRMHEQLIENRGLSGNAYINEQQKMYSAAEKASKDAPALIEYYTSERDKYQKGIGDVSVENLQSSMETEAKDHGTNTLQYRNLKDKYDTLQSLNGAINFWENMGAQQAAIMTRTSNRIMEAGGQIPGGDTSKSTKPSNSTSKPVPGVPNIEVPEASVRPSQQTAAPANEQDSDSEDDPDNYGLPASP